MKIKLTILTLLAVVGSANATITLNTFFGVATDSIGNPIVDGTLWALVVDNGDNTFAGGFGLNSSITEIGANADFSIGQSFTLGSLFGSDTVFAMGGFNGTANFSQAGFAADALTLNLGDNGLVAGRNAAFYFFPGVVYVGAGTYQIGTQIGAFNAVEDTVNGLQMTIPADGSTVGFGALDTVTGGNVAPANMQSVVLIPEPSVALLGAFGILALLRRRR